MSMQTWGLGGLVIPEAVTHNRIDHIKCPPLMDYMSSAARLHMTAESVGGFAMDSGIYQITNQINGKRYIGSAVGLKGRQADHLRRLRRGRHSNRYLQRAFAKYGEQAFVFVTLEYVEDTSQLIMREQHYLDTLKPEYNIAPVAGSQLGFRHSVGTRAQMSRAHRGKVLSKEHKQNISAALTGNHPTTKTKQKISATLMGHQVTKKAREKMRDVWTPERRQRQSDWMKKWRRDIAEEVS